MTLRSCTSRVKQKSVNATYKLGFIKAAGRAAATACHYMAVRLGTPSSDFLAA